MNDIHVDRNTGTGIVNYSDVSTEEVMAAIGDNRELAELITWTRSTRGGSARSRAGGLFDRDRFVCSTNPMEQMRVAADAMSDDIVGGFLDASEAMAIRNLMCNVADEDEKDIWEQILDSCDLEERVREVWREVASLSQAYVAVWYETKSFTVRGNGESGVKRKKVYKDLTVPSGLTVLDPFKIIPVGNFLFGQETLTYFADATERDVIDSYLLGDDASGADAIIKRLIVGKYTPDFRDRKEIANFGVDPNRLYVLNPKYVWRITATRPGYQRFAPVRMSSIFDLLDLKHQLHQADRAVLIGASQFILLVKKGTDKEPAKQFELDRLQGNMRSVSKVPVIVGDHRLNIEIITPKTDNTLSSDRYTVLDVHIMTRLYGMFISMHGRDDSLKLARVVARGLEARRENIIKSFMRHLILPTFALNAQLSADPDLMVHPKRIAIDFDPSLATYLLDLRDRGDLSRDSILSEVDYDESDEYEKRKIEAEKYDAVFTPPVPLPGMPGAAPAGGPPAAGAPNDPKRAGRAQGGNHGKGGNGNTGSGAGQAPRTGTPKDPKTGTSKASDDDE